MSNPERRVPCPREVWRAATPGRSITVLVSPEDAPGTVEFAGEITEEPEKTGDAWTTEVTITFTPWDALSPVQLEARKECGDWTAFRAFHWRHPEYANEPGEHVYEYVGRVVGLSIPDARWREDTEDSDREVIA